jgi:hypothetical protein
MIILALSMTRVESAKVKLMKTKHQWFDGYVFGGWAKTQAYVWKTENTFDWTITVGIFIEDIWGKDIVECADTYWDWGSIDNPYYKSFPKDATTLVPIGCNDDWCGACWNKECDSFYPNIKNTKFIWNNEDIQFVKGTSTYTKKNICHDDSTLKNTNYVLKLNVKCSNTIMEEPVDTEEIIAGKGKIDTVSTIKTVEKSSLTKVSGTTSEWFLEGAMNGGNKMGLELTDGTNKVGLEKNFGWSMKSGTKKTSSEEVKVEETKEITDEKVIKHGCDANDILYKVTRVQCATFDLKDCKPLKTHHRYPKAKFTSAKFRTCKQTQFPFCAEDKKQLSKELQIATNYEDLKTNEPHTAKAKSHCS